MKLIKRYVEQQIKSNVSERHIGAFQERSINKSTAKFVTQYISEQTKSNPFDIESQLTNKANADDLATKLAGQASEKDKDDMTLESYRQDFMKRRLDRKQSDEQKLRDKKKTIKKTILPKVLKKTMVRQKQIDVNKEQSPTI